MVNQYWRVSIFHVVRSKMLCYTYEHSCLTFCGVKFSIFFATTSECNAEHSCCLNSEQRLYRNQWYVRKYRWYLLTIATTIDQSSGPHTFLDKRTQKRSAHVRMSNARRTRTAKASCTDRGRPCCPWIRQLVLRCSHHRCCHLALTKLCVSLQGTRMERRTSYQLT